jgi:hypothetical protein
LIHVKSHPFVAFRNPDIIKNEVVKPRVGKAAFSFSRVAGDHSVVGLSAFHHLESAPKIAIRELI